MPHPNWRLYPNIHQLLASRGRSPRLLLSNRPPRMMTNLTTVFCSPNVKGLKDLLVSTDSRDYPTKCNRPVPADTEVCAFKYWFYFQDTIYFQMVTQIDSFQMCSSFQEVEKIIVRWSLVEKARFEWNLPEANHPGNCPPQGDSSLTTGQNWGDFFLLYL